MAPILEAVFATLILSDDYLPGAMVLGHSLQDKGAKGPLVVLVTMDTVSSDAITELKTIYDEIIPVNTIRNRTPANLYVMDRPDLISTFTKIELWRQTQYRRIVYIDADVVALRAPNELLTMDTEFAAAPDIGWPDCFNSGVMVLNPNMGDYYSLLALAQRGISFDGADQGLLNMHFRDWERLSFTYNCTPSGNYQYVPAYRHFQSSINMIHYIGREKPWTLGRENRYSGVYGELLGMWWSVYDKHYRVPKSAYYAGQYQDVPKKVQDHVRGEENYYQPGYSASQPQDVPPIVIEPPPEEPAGSVEQPIGDQPTPSEQVLQADFKPTPTAEVRRFSAPHVDWEPARAPPPANSKPEAFNFPTTQYDMSSDTQLFSPPTKYPEPPKDMWYEVPAKVPTPPQPKQIFPWESKARKATRVFPKAKPPTPPPAPEAEAEAGESPSRTAEASKAVEEEPPATVASPDPWQTYQRANAWDEMPEIEKYVQAFNQSRKGKLQVLHHTPSANAGTSQSTDPGRRASMKLTDFPTEIERPSLPVTPAPIRRPSFWGEERDQLGELPSADGVPKQEEWNPVAKLEELQRRQSEVLESGAQLEAKDIPSREMPESESAQAAIAAAEKANSPTAAPKMPKSILKEPKIGMPAEE